MKHKLRKVPTRGASIMGFWLFIHLHSAQSHLCMKTNAPLFRPEIKGSMSQKFCCLNKSKLPRTHTHTHRYIQTGDTPAIRACACVWNKCTETRDQKDDEFSSLCKKKKKKRVQNLARHSYQKSSAVTAKCTMWRKEDTQHMLSTIASNTQTHTHTHTWPEASRCPSVFLSISRKQSTAKLWNEALWLMKDR